MLISVFLVSEDLIEAFAVTDASVLAGLHVLFYVIRYCNILQALFVFLLEILSILLNPLLRSGFSLPFGFFGFLAVCYLLPLLPLRIGFFLEKLFIVSLLVFILFEILSSLFHMNNSDNLINCNGAQN